MRTGGAVLGNPTGMNPLCTTGYTEANGIACKVDGGAHVRSFCVFNNSTANAWAVAADLTTIPTSFANNMDASVSDAGPGMVGSPFLVPSQHQVCMGTEELGIDGWLTGFGFSIGMSTASTQPDGGTDAGTFVAAPNYFDITVNGQ